VATIQTGANEYTKTLVVMQKVLKIANLQHTKEYIAEHYRREDVINNEKVI
jgi:hypothetical protein